MYPSMIYKHTTTKEIENIIKSLKPKDSHAYDEISKQILTISSPFITSPVIYICSKAFSKGIFPDRLKFTLIKSVYKKGSTLDMTKCRPNCF